MIRLATPSDAEAIAAIYNYYVLNTTVTFEEQALSPEQMAERLRAVAASQLPWLVLEQDGRIAGYAYASRWKTRSAYRFTAESSVYVDRERVGQGLGKALYRELLPRLRQSGFHSAVGCLGLPNPASVALHEKCGFQKVAHFKEVGFKFGAWLDVGYWQALL
jgi:phosphinothricin acetyltransferase